MGNGDTQGRRIRVLFERAAGEVAVIAPFIKVDALQSLLEVIPHAVPLRCVTRWLPREIAAGVSDPEIFGLLEARGHFSLSLVDHLHAKIYIADDRCLAGSSNVTLTGLGEAHGQENIEVLVETTIDDPAVVAALDAISEAERPATRAMAQAARRLADNLETSTGAMADHDAPWFPSSRRPEQAYRMYSQPPAGYLGAADRVLLADVARADISPGVSENHFRAAVRTLLASIPISGRIIEGTGDTTLTRADVQPYLETRAGEQFSTQDLWMAFVNWMAYFYADRVMKQEIAEIALRRAQVLKSS